MTFYHTPFFFFFFFNFLDKVVFFHINLVVFFVFCCCCCPFTLYGSNVSAMVIKCLSCGLVEVFAAIQYGCG